MAKSDDWYLERFIQRTTQWGPLFEGTQCWIWLGGLKDGYGGTGWGGEFILVHRWAYQRFVGPIPTDMTIDHRCHSASADCAGGPTCPHRRCCNPAHLAVSPRAENCGALAHPPVHGTASRYRKGCQCEPCVAVGRARARSRKAAQRAARVLT